MKTSRFLLIVVAAAFLIAVSVHLYAQTKSPEGAIEYHEDRASSSLDVAPALARPLEEAVAHREDRAGDSSAGVTPTQAPFLTIGGKEGPNVYLQSLDINVEVTGNIASTRYTMVFRNKTDRILEGELTFPLPDGRTVTHYALDIDGRMREAVPVDKARATLVFEEIQRRQVDPGIIERVEGNNFRTRIYPFPRQGIRTISIGYEEELTLENDSLYYRLPMAYPKLEEFAVKATFWNSGQTPVVPDGNESEINFDKTGENYVATFARRNYQPARTLTFALPAPANIPQVMMQPAQGNFYFLASVAPEMEARKKQWSDELAIIWDVSLSGLQRNLRREIEMLDIIFTEKKNANVHLYYLNNRFKKMGEYKVNGGKWDELKKVLETAVFDGGTDFSQINLNNITGNELLFFSDGISTLSNADFLSSTNVNQSTRPIHCIVSSSKADYSTMRLISGKTKGKFVNVNALSFEKLKDELLNETLQFLGTEHGSSIREVYPNITTPVHGNFSIAGISNTNNAEMTLLFGFGDNVEKRINVKLDAQKAGSQGNIYKIWAQKKIAELDLEYEKNRAELTKLGQQFGIVTRTTSLMVLELISDYVRFGIEPPESEPALLAEYQLRQKGRENHQRDAERDMLKAAVASAKRLKRWHKTDYTPKKPESAPKSTPKDHNYPVPDNQSTAAPLPLLGVFGILTGCGSASQMNFDSVEKAEEQDGAKITLKPVRKNADYLKKLTKDIAHDYQLYLSIRDDYASSPAFYFDMADWFFKLGDRETALRVLTSIAELELEDVSLYRLLGYRFKEYGEHVLQKFACQKVIEWRPMEPQSYRDYALALADNGEPQAALDSLYSMLTKPFSARIVRRSRGIEEVAVTEMNRLIDKHPNLNTSKIDKRLIMSHPVDVRVAINWNTSNTIIDLHLRDPHGEVCYYGRPRTKIGGRLSYDNTSGYGPEQFMLKKAVKGKYQIHVNHYSSRAFVTSEPITVMVEIFTNYAGKDEQHRVVTLQLSEADRSARKRVLVAEFEF